MGAPRASETISRSPSGYHRARRLFPAPWRWPPWLRSGRQATRRARRNSATLIRYRGAPGTACGPAPTLRSARWPGRMRSILTISTPVRSISGSLGGFLAACGAAPAPLPSVRRRVGIARVFLCRGRILLNSKFGETIGAGDDVERARLDVIVDARQVFAEDAKKDQLNPPRKRTATRVDAWPKNALLPERRVITVTTMPSRLSSARKKPK